MSRTGSDQSPCVSSPTAAVNLSQECSGSDCGAHPVCLWECCPKRCSGNVSADDITVCNKRKRAARCGNLIWENTPKHSGNKSVQVWWPLCCWAPFYWEGTARKENTTLSWAINFKIYINIIRHVQTTTIWHSWMPTRQFDHHWLIDRRSNKTKY